MANHKQEEEALLNEMEVTGQAFEDMQEQNSRLIQQLREKDDANFKLMSERIKSNQVFFLFRVVISSTVVGKLAYFWRLGKVDYQNPPALGETKLGAQV